MAIGVQLPKETGVSEKKLDPELGLDDTVDIKDVGEVQDARADTTAGFIVLQWGQNGGKATPNAFGN